MKLLQEMLQLAEGSTKASRNEMYGFHNEARSKFIRDKLNDDRDSMTEKDHQRADRFAAKQFGSMVTKLVDAGHFSKHEHARDYLDSSYGRHLHDAIGDADYDLSNAGRSLAKTVKEFKRQNKLVEASMNEAGKVHTLPGSFPKRGAPEPWERARAFDKVNPKTGARPDRSMLRLGTGKYHAVEGSNEGDFIMVHVYRDDIDSGNYHGVNVVFMADGTVTSSTADKWANEQWHEDKDKIIAIAKKWYGADKIAAFVKRGGDADYRQSDDPHYSDSTGNGK